MCSWSWRFLSKSITRKGSDVPLSPSQRNPRKQGAGHIYHLSLFKILINTFRRKKKQYLPSITDQILKTLLLDYYILDLETFESNVLQKEVSGEAVKPIYILVFGWL